jgi:hypothetical protein
MVPKDHHAFDQKDAKSNSTRVATNRRYSTKASLSEKPGVDVPA